jgi:hypothetical protein
MTCDLYEITGLPSNRMRQLERSRCQSGQKRRSATRAGTASYWKDLDAYNPVQAAAKLTIPMLILQGERDDQVTMLDLQGWRDGLRDRANVTIKSSDAESPVPARRRQEHAGRVRSRRSHSRLRPRRHGRMARQL